MDFLIYILFLLIGMFVGFMLGFGQGKIQEREMIGKGIQELMKRSKTVIGHTVN